MICKVQLGNELGTCEDSNEQVGTTALPVGVQLLIQLHPYLGLAPLNHNQSFLILDNVG